MWRQRRTKKGTENKLKIEQGEESSADVSLFGCTSRVVGASMKECTSTLLPLCVPQSLFCPLADLWHSRHLETFRNKGGIFFFWPVKYEWESLSAVNSWPKDKVGNEHTAARQHWTRPFFFLQAMSFTVASGRSLMAFRNSKSVERKGLEGVTKIHNGANDMGCEVFRPVARVHIYHHFSRERFKIGSLQLMPVHFH